MIGFYGPGTKEDYPQDLGNDWPAAYVPIAVHTIPGKEDFVAPGDPDCPRERELKQLLRKTPEYQSYMAKHKWVLDFLGEKGGDGEVELFDIWKYEDVFFVEVRDKQWINKTLSGFRSFTGANWWTGQRATKPCWMPSMICP